MSRERVQRWSLALIGLFMLPTAIQATFAPESWFEDFPLGRGWVAAEGGVYDEHLVRDVGVLFLALIAVTAWSVWRREAMTIVAVAWLIQGVDLTDPGTAAGRLCARGNDRPARAAPPDQGAWDPTDRARSSELTLTWS